ncbi:MAG: hypothetical protein HFJ30_05790 [Clostridia bacterium]|jgi:translation elongation factor P/translation initiation factor 5A|nr:hypothetical protein [Clostridia bacterium]MCI9413444.1 hypothetical protein [Clostridia bacterium]
MEEKKKGSKLKIIIPIIVAIVALAIIGIVTFIIPKEGKEETPSKKELATSKYVDLRGIYVDKSDEKKHPDEALIYVLYTVKSDDKNIKFYTYMANNPGTALTIKINDTNEYKDTIYSSLEQNFRNTGYENLNDGQKVLAGTSMKCIGAFRVSKNDLKEGGIIRLTLKGTDSFEEVFEYKTDDVQYFENAKELLKNVDNETYEKAEKVEKEKTAKISSKLEKQIYNYLQENYFQWYISTIRMQLEFEGKKFKISSSANGSNLSNGGTYEIRKQVILLHYDTGKTNQLPYEFKNGEVSLTGTPE